MNIEITEHILSRSREISALLLWETGAINVNLNEPYKLVSGNFSPIYINCRKVISSPYFMHLFTAFAQYILEKKNIQIDIVAGGETAGIPFSAYVAQSLSLPMVYVRKSRKSHGIGAQVEGVIRKKNKVLLVEDLITDAGSKLGFIDSIKESGGEVRDVLVLFDREQGGYEALSEREIALHPVTNMSTVMEVAQHAKLRSDSEMNSVRIYLNNPKEWHKSMRLKYI